MTVDDWFTLFDALWDDAPRGKKAKLRGVDLYEWYALFSDDWDWVDRMYIDAESGGGE